MKDPKNIFVVVTDYGHHICDDEILNEYYSSCRKTKAGNIDRRTKQGKELVGYISDIECKKFTEYLWKTPTSWWHELMSRE